MALLFEAEPSIESDLINGGLSIWSKPSKVLHPTLCVLMTLSLSLLPILMRMPAMRSGMRWRAMLTQEPLPRKENEFFRKLGKFFPRLYDEKHMMGSCESLAGGLNQLATDLEVERIGRVHQAGSNSLLCAQTFFKLKQTVFGNELEKQNFTGILHGYNDTFQSGGGASW